MLSNGIGLKRPRAKAEAEVGMGDLFAPLQTPAIVLLLGTFATAIAALIITPFVQLRIANKQVRLGNRQADLSERHLTLVERQAAGAETSARAALISAASVGTHSIARFRQEWINALRRDLAEIHSLLVASAEAGATEEQSSKIAELRTRIELMLNPDEKASDDLVNMIDDLLPPVKGDPVELSAIFVARSHVILRAEWARVKAELRGDASRESVPSAD